MASVVTICNMALGNIGITQTIENIDDNNERSRVCKLYYEPIRDQMIRGMEPNWAQSFVALALVSGDPPPGWGYQYRYPTDCMFARRVTDESGARQSATAIQTDTVADPPATPFEVRSDASGAGRIIVTDQPDAYLWYTRRVTDPNDFDAEFTVALAWALAAAIAIPMKVSAPVAQFSANNARQLAGEAAVGSESESQSMDVRQSPSITGRL